MSAPTGPANAPAWVATVIKDIVEWVQNIRRGPQVLTSYTVTTLPDPADWLGGMIYVSNETGGAVPAFSDGTNFRRVTDRAIVS